MIDEITPTPVNSDITMNDDGIYMDDRNVTMYDDGPLITTSKKTNVN